MNQLEVVKVELEDFDVMAGYTEDSLAAPMVEFFWPVSHSDDDSNSRRNSWSMLQQRTMFLEDDSAHFLKVIDTNTGEIVALARWHFYPSGFDPNEKSLAWELGDLSKVPDPVLAQQVIKPPLHARGWMRKGPQWVLATIVTRKRFRRQGAGGKLLDWGINQARQDKTLAYVQSAPDVYFFYHDHGFRDFEGLVHGGYSWQIGDDSTLQKLMCNHLVADPVALVDLDDRADSPMPLRAK